MDALPIGLWIAERIAERRLLNDDGIDMSEDTWLELVLAFVTNEEKQTLQVPARERRGEHDDGNGYTVLSLQGALARFDPATFRKFKQSFCQDPVTVRVVTIAGLSITKKTDTPKTNTLKVSGGTTTVRTISNKQKQTATWRVRNS